MTTNGWLQIAFFSVALLLITKPLGIYVFKVFDGSMGWLRPLEKPLAGLPFGAQYQVLCRKPTAAH